MAAAAPHMFQTGPDTGQSWGDPPPSPPKNSLGPIIGAIVFGGLVVVAAAAFWLLRTPSVPEETVATPTEAETTDPSAASGADGDELPPDSDSSTAPSTEPAASSELDDPANQPDPERPDPKSPDPKSPDPKTPDPKTAEGKTPDPKSPEPPKPKAKDEPWKHRKTLD
jgi:outer membrane biosynthesis protein TonB